MSARRLAIEPYEAGSRVFLIAGETSTLFLSHLLQVRDRIVSNNRDS